MFGDGVLAGLLQKFEHDPLYKYRSHECKPGRVLALDLTVE
jgi:hypothetical protein